MTPEIWKRAFTATTCPPLPCPTCNNGHLVLDQASFKSSETAHSKSLHHEEDWDYEWVSLVFTAWCNCSNPKCSEVFAVSGEGSMEPTWDGEGGTTYERLYYLRFCCPMPKLFPPPKKTPNELRDFLNESFALFLIDRKACANRLRIALESLLDFAAIPRSSEPTTLKEVPLHNRIEMFSQQNPSLGGLMMGLKWLGNTGSHHKKTSISKNELLEAFEVVEHLLVEVIDGKSARLAQIAERLAKRHGPEISK